MMLSNRVAARPVSLCSPAAQRAVKPSRVAVRATAEAKTEKKKKNKGECSSSR